MRRLFGFLLVGLLTATAYADKVFFFDKASAKERILSEEKEAYFSKHQIVELAAYQGREVSDAPLDEQRAEYKKVVADYVGEFTDAEKQALESLIVAVDIELKAWVPMIAGLQWRLLKMDNRFCSGFPHTREDFIVVPTLLAELAVHVETEGSGQFADFLKEVLIHEKMHVAQRHYLEKFDSIYKELWGFDHIEPVCAHPSFEDRLAHNPDALDYGYVTYLREQWYLPLVLYREGTSNPVMGKDFVSQLYLLQRDGDSAEIATVDNKPVRIPIDDEDYRERIPTIAFAQGGDHPHEILAYSATKILGYGSEPEEGNEEKLIALQKAMAAAFAETGE